MKSVIVVIVLFVALIASAVVFGNHRYNIGYQDGIEKGTKDTEDRCVIFTRAMLNMQQKNTSSTQTAIDTQDNRAQMLRDMERDSQNRKVRDELSSISRKLDEERFQRDMDKLMK